MNNQSSSQSQAQPTTIKEKLLHSWDQMKAKYPLVVDITPVKGDIVKEQFLHYIDGLKNVEEIAHYFTLEPSEAHLILSDLLSLRVIRFIDNTERLAYLNRQNSELKTNLDFISSENNKLKGEERYLKKQVQSKENEIVSMNEKIPEVQRQLNEFNKELETLKSSSITLWDYNSDLLGLIKDMSCKEKQITEILNQMESSFPKMVKKKKRVANLLSETKGRVVDTEEKNSTLKKKMSIYHDSIEEIKGSLFDIKSRLTYLKNKD
ncbi:MAG: hypothetical protein HQK49_04535 [Oligoflexia bacterium]|nr:hypothetical protein [Oligoflexia bacterium]